MKHQREGAGMRQMQARPNLFKDNQKRRPPMIASAVPTVSKSIINEPLLEDRFAALEVARSWKPRVLSRLESFIRNGTDRDLYRINALAFGARTGIAEAEAIDLLVHAAAIGLFEMDWLLPVSYTHLTLPTILRV